MPGQVPKLILDCGTGDGRLGAICAGKAATATSYPMIVLMDTDDSRFDEKAKTAARYVAPQATTILFKKGSVFDESIPMPVSDWVVVNPPFDQDALCWLMMAMNQARHVLGLVTIILPARYTTTLLRFTELVTHDAPYHFEERVLDSRRQHGTHHNMMIEVVVFSFRVHLKNTDYIAAWKEASEFAWMPEKIETWVMEKMTVMRDRMPPLVQEECYLDLEADGYSPDPSKKTDDEDDDEGEGDQQ